MRLFWFSWKIQRRLRVLKSRIRNSLSFRLSGGFEVDWESFMWILSRSWSNLCREVVTSEARILDKRPFTNLWRQFATRFHCGVRLLCICNNGDESTLGNFLRSYLLSPSMIVEAITRAMSTVSLIITAAFPTRRHLLRRFRIYWFYWLFNLNAKTDQRAMGVL